MVLLIKSELETIGWEFLAATCAMPTLSLPTISATSCADFARPSLAAARSVSALIVVKSLCAPEFDSANKRTCEACLDATRLNSLLEPMAP